MVSFTKQELAQIQKKIIGKCLSAAGYSSKMPRAVVFGPLKYGGMQWQSPYGIMVYEQLKLLIGSIRLGDTVGTILRVQLKWLQLHAGTSIPLLEEQKNISYLQDCWLKSLHVKMVDSQIKVHVAESWVPTKRHENDVIIMDYVRKYLPEEYWEPINQCRIYMNAVTVSDLTTFEGTTIPASVYKVQGPYRPSRLKYPLQPRPSKRIRKQWEYFINHITEDSIHLLTPMGGWIDIPYQIYPFVVNTEHTFIFKRIESRWEIFYRQDSNRNEYKKLAVTTATLPTHWHPIQVILQSQGTLRGIHGGQETFPEPHPKAVEPGLIANDITKNIIGHWNLNNDQLKFLLEDGYHGR